MHTDTPENLTDDGLDALVARLNAGYERLALLADAPYADHLSLDGSRLTMRRRPVLSLYFNESPAAGARQDAAVR